MATSDRPRDLARAGQLAPPRRGADHEIELSRTVEASMPEGTTRPRDAMVERHATHDPSGASRVYERPGRGTHIALVVGALVMLLTPWMLRAALARSGEDAIVSNGPPTAPLAALLQVLVGGCGVLVASRRLRRSISPSRRTAYIGGAWLLCLGAGLVASRLDTALGDVVFDAGTLAVFLLLFTDSVLRRRARGDA
jgi:hypothetical protein